MKAKKALKISLIVLCSIIFLFLICFLCWCLSFVIIGNTGLPRLDITTSEKITSKEVYVDCTVSISNTDKEFELSEVDASIRGRGNSTWQYYPKKPYRIKFDKKTSLFGEEKNKSWVLLAMYNDYSRSKDALAFSIAKAIGTDAFVPSYHYVDVYINGKYNGLYLLTDQVDENKGRTGVEYDFSPSDTEVPFLIELDDHVDLEGTENIDWFYVGGLKYAIKYPKADERYTNEQFNYIKSYIETVDRLSKKQDVTIEELSEYIDIDSFIDYYLIQEIMIQAEVKYKSVFMSKSIDGKLKMGPVWDYDWSLGGPSITNYSHDTTGFVTEKTWFYKLYTNSDEFKELVVNRWNEIKDIVLECADTFKAESKQIAKASTKDWLRWRWFIITGNYKRNLNKAIDTLKVRVEWLDREFNKE